MITMGCASCGITKRDHGQRWNKKSGWHGWIEPSKELIAERLRIKYQIKCPVDCVCICHDGFGGEHPNELCEGKK